MPKRISFRATLPLPLGYYAGTTTTRMWEAMWSRPPRTLRPAVPHRPRGARGTPSPLSICVWNL